MMCRHCGAGLSLQMADLGACPPSNAFNLTPDSKEVNWPLRVLVCTSCWLVQTDIDRFRLNNEQLFKDSYPYYSSTSPSWVEHARQYVAMISERLQLGPDSMAIEVGSNDGYLLQHFKTPCYGYEPTNTALTASKKGIVSCYNFFGEVVACNARDHWRGPADLMICNNVLAHVPDINDFVKGFVALLKPNGVATFEFPSLLELIRQNAFDTIYHEHYSYLSLTAVKNIFEANGLQIFDVEMLPTHGGSLRVYAQLPTGQQAISGTVAMMLRAEDDAGITTTRIYEQFQAQADKVKNDFLAFLIDAKRKGETVAGFGAAAKGNTLLSYAGVRSDLIAYIVDETPAKQGRFTPGTGIPVVAQFGPKPDYIVCFPWNFRSDIVDKLTAMWDERPKIVFAIPELEII